MLVVRSLATFTCHTGTLNLYAPVTLPFGHSLAMAHDQHGLASTIGACARAQPPRAVQGLDSHTLRAARSWMGGPRRRSDEGCVRRLTQSVAVPGVWRQKSWLPHLVGFASEERG